MLGHRHKETNDMNIALTGSTGFVGSHILTELLKHGHDVIALVRNDAQAEVVAARGATPAVVDLYDTPAVARVLAGTDGAIHTASPGDETSANLDSAVVDAALEAFAGTGKPYLHISGIWVYGNNSFITEDSPHDAPALVAWKQPIDRRILDAEGLRGVVIVAGVAYGDGGGALPGLLLSSPRDEAGNLIMFGSGQQHWPTVHVADLARKGQMKSEGNIRAGRLGDIQVRDGHEVLLGPPMKFTAANIDQYDF